MKAVDEKLIVNRGLLAVLKHCWQNSVHPQPRLPNLHAPRSSSAANPAKKSTGEFARSK